MFIEGAQYVFDGNRVTAQGRNGIGRWRLNTVNHDPSLMITPDLRIRKYRRNKRTCLVRVIRSFETVVDALKPLEEALRICSQHGHVWVADIVTGKLRDERNEWCLICGAEQLVFEAVGTSGYALQRNLRASAYSSKGRLC